MTFSSALATTMQKRWLLAATLRLAVFAPTSAAAQERTWEWQWSTHPVMFMWGAGGLVMMLMMLVFWALVIAGLILALRWLMRQGGAVRHDEALEILRQRYARGEID